MGRLSERLWVGGTTSLISFIGFSSQLFVVLPTYPSLLSPSLLRLLIPFNALLFLVFWNYYLCIVTDPGGVPQNWEPEYGEMGTVEVKKLTGGPRFCRTCRGYKPPRAHHCRQCKKCVLKMDHHCPWVNNCVGHGNYGHFIRFLCAVDVACSYHLWMITMRAFGPRAFMSEPSATQVVMLILNYTACVPVLIAVGMFSLYHLWSLAMNTTTIEGWEKDKVAILKRRGKIREYKYPYHLGVVANVKSVLGENPLLWCWPQKVGGNGLRYTVAQDLDPSSQYTWPPRNEFSDRERAASRTDRIASGSPFTYGTGLNPSLNSSSSLRQRQPRRSNTSPYHAGFEQALSSDSEGDGIPLGRIAARRARTNGPTTALGKLEVEEEPGVRVRRGSEGFEVRPVRVGGSEGGSSEGWEQVEDGRVSEGDLDEEGDRRWVGERYKRYEAVASSSDEGSTDSMDEYLDD